MTFSLLHPLVAVAGLAAISIPIIIHLLLRQRPKTINFPALILLRKRQTQTIRRLRLQNWLLLLARCLLLALLGLAMARPTVRSSLLSIDQQAPIAAVMVFDDSPSMSLKEKGQTRLARAQELAVDAVRRMPSGSKIAVIESSNPVPSVFQPIPSTVGQIESLDTEPIVTRVNDAIAAGLRELAQSTELRKEIYVFSDFAAHAWSMEDGERLTRLLKEAGDEVAVYLIDVHADKSNNVAIGEIELSSQVLPSNSPLTIDAVVKNGGNAVDNVVRLLVDGEPRGEKPIHLDSSQAVSIDFTVPGLTQGFHQGELKLATNDEMPFDDTRYFTVDVRPPVRVLIVAEDKSESLYWRKALLPEVDSSGSGETVNEILPSQLSETSLGRYAVVCLLDVARLDQANWLKLNEYVSKGGGLFVSLGPRVDADSYNTPAAQQSMPARLVQVAPPGETTMAPMQLTHPVLAKFKEWGESDLADWPVLRYWKAEPVAGSSVVVIPYANGDAALIERSFGEGRRGRVILMTTAAHYQQQGDNWTELPLGWSYVVLADEIVRYLAGTSETMLNYETGDTVDIERNPGDPFSLYAVTAPDSVVERIAVDPREQLLEIPSVRAPGQYRVDASQLDRSYAFGFSVNVAPSESSLEPVEGEKLKTLFGEASVLVVHNPTELEQMEGSSRVGRELFPWIIMVMAVLFFAESYLSNRFYRNSRPPALGRPASLELPAAQSAKK